MSAGCQRRRRLPNRRGRHGVGVGDGWECRPVGAPRRRSSGKGWSLAPAASSPAHCAGSCSKRSVHLNPALSNRPPAGKRLRRLVFVFLNAVAWSAFNWENPDGGVPDSLVIQVRWGDVLKVDEVSRADIPQRAHRPPCDRLALLRERGA